VNVYDFRILKHPRAPQTTLRCKPGKTRRLRLLSPGAHVKNPALAAARASLLSAFDGLPLPTSLANACTATVPVAVPVGTRLRLRAQVGGSLGTQAPRLTLACTS
jgi:hypothetical protein